MLVLVLVFNVGISVLKKVVKVCTKVKRHSLRLRAQIVFTSASATQCLLTTHLPGTIKHRSYSPTIPLICTSLAITHFPWLKLASSWHEARG